MVLESLLSPINAENKSYKALLYGFLLSIICAFFALLVFRERASMILIFLVTLGATPFMYSLIKYEEKKDLDGQDESALLKEHSKALSVFGYLFLGTLLAFILLYIVLPPALSTTLFDSQFESLTVIRGAVTEPASPDSWSDFSDIFLNNVKVLMFTIIFSFIFGAGAIFILTWNSSVIAVAIGNYIREQLATVTSVAGFGNISNYFSIIGLGLLRYVIHGIPEILGYFFAALAGGIISVAIIRHDYRSVKFEHILLDSANLLAISLGLIFVAAVFEVWITPIVFPL